jgi:hypothetical protein
MKIRLFQLFLPSFLSNYYSKTDYPLISMGDHLSRRVTTWMNQKGEKHEENYP